MKKNKKSSRFKIFRRFRGFALHYESAESAESWENLVLLLDKWLDYFLTEFKLVDNVQNIRKRPAFYLKDVNRGHVIQELIEIDNFCCIASQTFIISYFTYQSSNFKTSIKKNEKSSRFKNFRRFRGFALHYESEESAKSCFFYLSEKKMSK